jgi:hypothetical protein
VTSTLPTKNKTSDITLPTLVPKVCKKKKTLVPKEKTLPTQKSDISVFFFKV